MQLKYIGESNENFITNKEYHCTYLEIQEGKKAIMKVQADKSIELKYENIEDFIKTWRLIKDEN